METLIIYPNLKRHPLAPRPHYIKHMPKIKKYAFLTHMRYKELGKQNLYWIFSTKQRGKKCAWDSVKWYTYLMIKSVTLKYINHLSQNDFMFLISSIFLFLVKEPLIMMFVLQI